MSGRRRGRRRDFVYPPGPPPRMPGPGRVRTPVRRPRRYPVRATWIGVLEMVVLAAFWAVLLIIGVGFPLLAVTNGLYNAGYLARNPLAPEMVSTFGWSLLWTALALAVVSRVWKAPAQFIVLLLIVWFGSALFVPLLVSTLLMLPVHALVSSVFGVDVIREWRPVLHTVLSVLGAMWGVKIVADSSTGGYDAGGVGYRSSSGGWGALSHFMETAMHATSRSPDDGGWSTDSGDGGDSGGDSD